MTHKEIDKLNLQIRLAHERIDTLSQENLELKLFVHALLFSHPNPGALANHIDVGKERYLATATYKTISDTELRAVRAAADRVLASLRVDRPEP